MLLKGKTALITGAGRGIGRAIALAFAEQGCQVALAARTRAELLDVRQAIEARGGEAVAWPCDLTVNAELRAAAAEILNLWGRIDILVNNAGYAVFKPFIELNDQDWFHTMDVNLYAPLALIRAVLPDMIARRSGRIINISSVSGLRALPDQSAYCVSKHAINGLTKCLALELRPFGIAVHSICPGGVITRLSELAMPHRDKNDWMTPEDIAHTALYLASLPARVAVDMVSMRRFHGEPMA